MFWSNITPYIILPVWYFICHPSAYNNLSVTVTTCENPSIVPKPNAENPENAWNLFNTIISREKTKDRANPADEWQLKVTCIKNKSYYSWKFDIIIIYK